MSTRERLDGVYRALTGQIQTIPKKCKGPGCGLKSTNKPLISLGFLIQVLGSDWVGTETLKKPGKTGNHEALMNPHELAITSMHQSGGGSGPGFDSRLK